MNNEASSLHEQMALLKARVFELVRECPAGRVTTYGWVAKAVGFPRGARMIGWIMNEVSPGVPAQRVINSKGELSGSWAFGSPDRMRLLLESEGIVFTADNKVDLKRYGWNPMIDLNESQRADIFSRVDGSMESPSPRLLGLMQHDPASPFKATGQS